MKMPLIVYIYFILTVVFASKLSAGSPFFDRLPSVVGTSPLSPALLSGTLMAFLSDPIKIFLYTFIDKTFSRNLQCSSALERPFKSCYNFLKKSYN